MILREHERRRSRARAFPVRSSSRNFLIQVKASKLRGLIIHKWNGNRSRPRHLIATSRWPSSTTRAPTLLCFHVAGCFTAGSTRRQESRLRTCGRHTGEPGRDEARTCAFFFLSLAGQSAPPTWPLPRQAAV